MHKEREPETPEERAERRFNDQAKVMHGDRLVIHYLDGIRRAILAQTADHGKWMYIQTYAMAQGLAAIALAASTPTDNSEEVKAAVVKATEELAKSEGVLQTAIDNAPK